MLCFWFPLAFTRTCTAELCATRDDMELLQRPCCEVLGISIDTPQSLARSKEDYQLNSPCCPISIRKLFMRRAVTKVWAQYERSRKAGALVVDSDGVGSMLSIENAGKFPILQPFRIHFVTCRTSEHNIIIPSKF